MGYGQPTDGGAAAERLIRWDGRGLLEGLEVLTQPVGELASVDAAGGQIQHDALLLIKAGIDLCAVQHEKRFHGGMADSLVAVDKGMVSHQREAEGGRLLRQRWIEVATGQRHLGLGEGRFQRAEIPNPGSTPVASRSRR